MVLPKLKALEPGLDALQRAHLLIVLARRYRAAHESGEDLLQRTDFRGLSLHLLVVLSEGATELVSLALTDSMEIRFLFRLMQLRVLLAASDRQGGRELLLRIAHRVPEILAAMTNQELPRVQWCIAMAATWAEAEGRKRVHDWMVAELERAESSWRVEDLLGCCVVGVKPVSRGYQVGEFVALDTMTLEAVVPRAWLLEKLKDRIQNATETELQGTHGQVPFAALISYGLWKLHESINDDKEEVVRLAGAPDERGDAG